MKVGKTFYFKKHTTSVDLSMIVKIPFASLAAKTNDPMGGMERFRAYAPNIRDING